MRTTPLVISILFAFSAAAQTEPVDRIIQIHYADNPQSFGELATLVRTIVEVPRFTTDQTEKSLELRGSADEVGLAEWLVQQLDRPQSGDSDGKSQAVRQYTMNSGKENVVRIFYLTNAPTVQTFQQVATLVRTTAEIRRVFTYNAPRAMVARGSADQIALAAWLVNGIDQLEKGIAPGDYHLPESDDLRGETVVHLFHVAHAASIQDFQEIVTAIRTIADVRRVFTYNEPRIMVARGTAEQIVLTRWLAEQLDKPALDQPAAVTAQSSAPYDYQTPYDKDNIVRVFYLRSPTVQEFQQTATQVRTKIGIRRVFTCNATRAMAVRGTVDQVAGADRMVKELDASLAAK